MYNDPNAFRFRLLCPVCGGTGVKPKDDAPLRDVEAVAKFAELKARQFTEQAFGDSRVEDASRCFEDIAAMLRAMR